MPSASPTGPALPWSPGTSCSGPSPPYPELGSDHNNSPDPERGLRSLLSHHSRTADREAANKGRAWQGQGQGRCSGTNAALGQEAWTRVLALAEHRPWFHTEPGCPSLSSPKPAVGCCLSFQPTGHVEVGGKVTASDGPSQPPELFTAFPSRLAPPSLNKDARMPRCYWFGGLMRWALQRTLAEVRVWKVSGLQFPHL